MHRNGDTYEVHIRSEALYVIVFNFCLLAMLVWRLRAAVWFVGPGRTLRKRGTPDKLGTHRSPAANDGKEPNKSGCLGRGDSLETDRISIQTYELNTRALPEIRMFKGILGTYSLIWVVGKEGREQIMPCCCEIRKFLPNGSERILRNFNRLR